MRQARGGCVWWLSARRRARDLDGAGNRARGARWNSARGRGVVYASMSVATCVLETFVHFGPKLRVNLPDNFMLAEIDVPDDAGILRIHRDEILADAGRPRAMGAPGISAPATNGSSAARRWS